MVILIAVASLAALVYVLAHVALWAIVLLMLAAFFGGMLLERIGQTKTVRAYARPRRRN